MIDAALAYARAGRTTDRAERVNLGALVPEIVAFLAPPADVRIEIAPGLPWIVAERVPLEQVLRNLLANAITYRRASGACVRVSARDVGDSWELAVADNGPGIAASQRDRIWRLFHTSRPGEGTGLGLALVRRIVESHGGGIRVDSSEGEGSTFYVRWPKHPVQPIPPSASPAWDAPL
jgi:signal transduction histidine kinase